MRCATPSEHHYATYVAKAAYCRAWSLRVDERSCEPKQAISTIIISGGETGIASRVIRHTDLAIYDGQGRLNVVVRAELKEAKQIVERIRSAHGVAGLGSRFKVESISESVF